MALTDFEQKEKKEDDEVIKLKKFLKRQELEKQEQGKYFLKTKQGREYTVLFKPKIELPYEDKVIEEQPDFVFLKGKNAELFDLKGLEKELKVHKNPSKKVKKEIAEKVLKKAREVELLLYVKKNLNKKQLDRVIITSFYLKPKNILIITEDYVKPEVKMIIPNSIKLIENTGLNQSKAKEEIERVI